MIVGSIRDMTISVLNVYAPIEEKETFFKLIAKVIISDAKGMILMGGVGMGWLPVSRYTMV